LYSVQEGSFIQLDNSFNTELFITHSVIVTELAHQIEVFVMLAGIGKTHDTA
jgi:hypothetical protein